MASSSKKPTKGRGGSSSGKGGSPESHGDILGRPTVDPWYRSGERFPSVPASLQPPPSDWEWLVIREDSAADMAWTPNFREIRDLQIQRNEMLAVPLVFDFQCSRAIEWADWIDLELADRGFCDRLEQAGVLRSILISRCSNMYRDTEALRQLVRRWCPSTHMFFFAHGELTVTLEDVENHWLLPILGDQDPADLVLSPEELEIEAALADYIGRRNVALGTQAARFKPWMEHFNRETKPSIRRAAFVAYWLSKCVFGEHPAYSIKPLYFPLAVKVAAGEHALEYIRKGRKPYEAQNKFALMPKGVVANVGDFQGDVPAVYRWVGCKFYDHSLIPSLDSESKVCWRPYGVSHRGFMYESVMSGFSNIEAQDYSLIAGDTTSLAYLSATNAGWLPVLSSDGLRFTVYSAHRVRKQFGFDQEVPAVMGVAAGEIPIINPFLRTMAFAYWSGVAPRVIVPSGDRVGIYTTAMSNYWRGLMAAMVEFRNSGRGDVSHLLESYTSPLPHPLLTLLLWLRDHPHVAAPGKVPSSRGRRTASAGISAVKRKQPDRSKKGEAASKDSPAQASKRIKTTAGRVSKEVSILKTAVQDPLPAGEAAAQGVSAPVSKKPVRKTRAGKKTFVPPAFPSAPASIAARVAARKSSGRGIVYSEKRSKQRADTVARIPIEIPRDPSGAAAQEIESEDTEAAVAETVSGADDFAADISSADSGSVDTDAILSASFGERGCGSRVDPYLQKKLLKKYVTVGVVTGVERVVETTPVAVTSSGGTVQGDLSGSGSHVDPSLLDSSPSTRQYVRRARRGSLVSTDSERTTSVTVRVPTPPSPLPESGATAPTPIITAAEASAATAAPESEFVPTAIEEASVGEEGLAHVPEVPEEVAASEEPVQADVTPGSDVPIIEGELAQDHVDDVDMADTHDSYDEVLAEAEDNMAGAQAADMEVTAPVAAQTSPTKTAGSGNETVAEEEERRLQTAAVESAIRRSARVVICCQVLPHWGLLFLADMDAFFREFDLPQGGIRFLKALWKKHTRLEDITEVHILEWKAVVQEAIEGGFKFGFILDYLRRLAHDIFSRRVLAELRVAEARVTALRDALNTVAPKPMGLGFCLEEFLQNLMLNQPSRACCLEHIILCILLSFTLFFCNMLAVYRL
uniref:Aminotransferase-like plant mobile domain-containing protein n=1 Tax=Fagus sylvatica TaxID=28930 RepID=A0A2N9I6E6_FAGSY